MWVCISRAKGACKPIGKKSDLCEWSSMHSSFFQSSYVGQDTTKRGIGQDCFSQIYTHTYTHISHRLYYSGIMRRGFAIAFMSITSENAKCLAMNSHPCRQLKKVSLIANGRLCIFTCDASPSYRSIQSFNDRLAPQTSKTHTIRPQKEAFEGRQWRCDSVGSSLNCHTVLCQQNTQRRLHTYQSQAA